MGGFLYIKTLTIKSSRIQLLLNRSASCTDNRCIL